MFLFSLICVDMIFYPGVSIESYPFHQKHINIADQTFTCYDHSKVIPLSKLNDHHRDCDDGSDELGTAEGPEDIPFFCKNTPYISQFVNRSQVGNGECICCDGSDEMFNPNVQCPNTCAELDKPRHLLLNKLKGVYYNGIKHKSIAESEGYRLFNRTQKTIHDYSDRINKLQKEIELIQENSTLMEMLPIAQQYPIIAKLWKLLFFIKNDDLTYSDVFNGAQGKINNLERKINNYNNSIQAIQSKYAIIKEHDLPIQFTPLVNVSFPWKEYNMLLFKEFFKGQTSIGKFKAFNEDSRTIFYEDGEYCPEINEGMKTIVNLECWNEGLLFEVVEKSKCLYEARVGTQEVCDAKDLMMLSNMTHKELIALKERNGFRK
ncbi:hypothetical protein TRFO_23597 [Tritrichomonas foetus]|uniref:Glucosidase 2 subunit beta n=1 Tax=Tritrichomonas foetus TaxID=1144522 RepID=A0A1J4K987_9EUKA|nr:hypothetical protein TRFO_23597 [Tritrichomonas foetus]|eukprot:OHT08057.1 hypothetical protein TRFO_23597 [Tritrichomonas foetus]